MDPQNGIILVAGGTGRLGYHITQQLLKAGFQVRLITRNHKSAESVFKGQMNEFESVFECDVFQEAKMQKAKIDSGKEIKSILNLAFEHSRKGNKVQGFVNALGVNLKTSEDSQIIEETATKMFISLCKSNKVPNFVLVSSCLVTRPYHIIAFLINFLARDALKYKVLAENALRKSGLNYIVVRPGGLIGDQNKQIETTDYEISQGDQKSGRITRATVGNIVVEAMMDTSLPKQLTFECFCSKENLKQKYRPFNGRQQLLADTEKNHIEVSHSQAKSFYLIILVAILTIIIAFLWKQF